MYPENNSANSQTASLSGMLFNHRRFAPWYDDRADYNTDAKSYYDYLARTNKLLDAISDLMNGLLKREISFSDTDTIDFNKSGDWEDNDTIDVNADVKISSKTETSENGQLHFNNGIKLFDDGLFVRDTENTYDDLSLDLSQRGINVKWFGAKGDNITDDTKAFKDAINKARYNFINNSSNSNVIIVPNGNYVISDTLIIPPYLKLKSMGNTRLLINNLKSSIKIDYFEEDYDNEIISNYIKQGYTRGYILDGNSGGLSIIYNAVNDVTNTHSTGVIIGSDSNKSLPVARLSLNNVFISGFNYGLQIIGNNNFLLSFYNMHIELNKNNVLIGGYDNTKNTINSGENINFYSSVISSATNNFVFNINGFDINLYGVSIDYSKVAFKFYRSGSNVSMYGGHVEDNNQYVNLEEIKDIYPTDSYPNINFIDTKFYFYGEFKTLFVSKIGNPPSLINLDNVHMLGGFLTDSDYLSTDGFNFITQYVNTGSHRMTPISPQLNPIIGYDYSSSNNFRIVNGGYGETTDITTNVPNSRYYKAVELVGIDNHLNFVKIDTPYYPINGRQEIYWKVPYYTDKGSTFTNMSVFITFKDKDDNVIKKTEGELQSPGTGELGKWIFRYGMIRKIPINATTFSVEVSMGSAFKDSRKLIGPLNINLI